MCGRFSLTSETNRIVEAFDIDEVKGAFRNSYNIAPGQDIGAIIEDNSRRLGPLRWGLIPSWADDPRIGSRMINARAEGLEQKASFKTPLRQKRCLIPADGFYEWKKEGNRKTPFYVFLKDKSPFVFAGLWDIWKSPQGEKTATCTIITTSPNSLVKELHNRMPVILPKEHIDLWLDSSMREEEKLLSLLKPYPAEEMECHEVSPLVNSPEEDSEKLF